MVDKCINLPLMTDRDAPNVAVIVPAASILPHSPIPPPPQTQAIRSPPPALLENLRNGSTK